MKIAKLYYIMSRYEEGYSLIEMLIVLSLIMAVSLSFRINTGPRSLEGLGLSVRSMFFLAKSGAIHKGRTYGILFSEDGFIELYDSCGAETVNLSFIESGQNRLVQRISIKAFIGSSYGIICGDIPDPNNQYIIIPDISKPIKMGKQNIMHIKPAGGVTNGSVYFMDADKKNMLCIRTAYAYTRLFLYFYSSNTGQWQRL